MILQDPVLILGPEGAVETVAEGPRKALHIVVETAIQRRSAIALLRRRNYSLLLVDEAVAEADRDASEAMYEVAGTASVVEVNFAISGSARVVRQARATLQRRAADLARARELAARQLSQELASTLSGLLLESQLALREAAPPQAAKLQHVVHLAGQLKERLRVV